MISTVLFAFAVLGGQANPVVCPIMGSPVNEKSPAFAYAGAKFQICCAGCEGPFAKDAATVISKNEKGRTIGVSMYDPVSTSKIDPKKAKGGFSDFNGIRFYFASEENKKAFDAEPKKYGTTPEKEALYCAVMKHGIAGYEKAGAYVDHEGVRYYLCCPNCSAEMKKDPAKYAANAKDAVAAPKAVRLKN